MESNYEKQVLRARTLFLQYDQDVMINKLRLKADAEYLYLTLLDRTYRIERKSGKVEVRKQAGFTVCLDYQVVMILYDILCHSKERPVLSGTWRGLSSLQITHSSPPADRFTAPFGRVFSGKIQKLDAACKELKGKKLSTPASADVCYQIPLFSFYPVIFQFWDGDEEFPPKIMLLWDEHSLDFLNFETLYYVMGHLLERLKKSVVDKDFH